MKKSRTLISIMLICLLTTAMSPIFAASGEESGVRIFFKYVGRKRVCVVR